MFCLDFRYNTEVSPEGVRNVNSLLYEILKKISDRVHWILNVIISLHILDSLRDHSCQLLLILKKQNEIENMAF